MGELGFEHYQTRLVMFLMEEAIVHKTIPSAAGHAMNFWIEAIQDDQERDEVRRRYYVLSDTSPNHKVSYLDFEKSDKISLDEIPSDTDNAVSGSSETDHSHLNDNEKVPRVEKEPHLPDGCEKTAEAFKRQESTLVTNHTESDRRKENTEVDDTDQTASSDKYQVNDAIRKSGAPGELEEPDAVDKSLDTEISKVVISDQNDDYGEINDTT